MATGYIRNSLLFLSDSLSKQQFLVNTGAEVSVLPATGLDRRLNKPGPLLAAANGSSIKTYGMSKLSLNFASNTYHWDFGCFSSIVRRRFFTIKLFVSRCQWETAR